MFQHAQLPLPENLRDDVRGAEPVDVSGIRLRGRLVGRQPQRARQHVEGVLLALQLQELAGQPAEPVQEHRVVAPQEQLHQLAQQVPQQAAGQAAADAQE